MSTEVLVALLAALLAGTVSGLSGFGYALVSVPLLLLVFDPATVIVVLSFIGIFTNALVVLDSFCDVAASLVASLMPWSVLGLIVGTEILRLAPSVYIQLTAGF